jgi:hypothetical protein
VPLLLLNPNASGVPQTMKASKVRTSKPYLEF